MMRPFRLMIFALSSIGSLHPSRSARRHSTSRSRSAFSFLVSRILSFHYISQSDRMNVDLTNVSLEMYSTVDVATVHLNAAMVLDFGLEFAPCLSDIGSHIRLVSGNRCLRR
jgi:hypothetical protein